MKLLFVIFLAAITIFIIRKKANDAPKITPTKKIKRKINKNDLILAENDSDPYIWFHGPVGFDTPKEFIPLLDTVRKQTDIEKRLQKKLRSDVNGNIEPLIVNDCYYSPGGQSNSPICGHLKIPQYS